jgi:hypothetical protein
VIAVLLVGSLGTGGLLETAGKARATTPASPITLPFNSVSSTSDGTPPTSLSASFDIRGNSYSAQAMAAAGLTSGATVTTNGLTFTWPSVTPGSPDNVVAEAQTIALPSTPGATMLGFLGSASDRPLTGTATIAYTDGTTTTATLEFDDWALLGAPPPPGPFSDNSIVASMPYRNTASGAKDNVPVYVFFTSLALDPSKTAASITLPTATADIAEIHIFAMAIGPSTTATGSPTATAVASGTTTPVAGTGTSTAVPSTTTTTTPVTGTGTSTAVPSTTTTGTPAMATSTSTVVPGTTTTSTPATATSTP